MFNNGICPNPRCQGKLVEVRGFRQSGVRFDPSPKGFTIKTACSRCKRIIGYRPAEDQPNAHRKTNRSQPSPDDAREVPLLWDDAVEEGA